MRDPYERIAGGPFRDDTHRAAVEAAHSQREWLQAHIAECRRMLADVTPDQDPIGTMQLAGRIDQLQRELAALDEPAAVEAAAVDLSQRPLGESQAAISGGPATSVWSGGRNGSGGLPTKVTQVEANPLYPALQSACQQVNEAERELRKFGYRNRKQAPGMRPPKATVMLVAPDALDAHVTILQDAFAAIYDAATRALASAGPLPLASTEPWVESDEEYAKRLPLQPMSNSELHQFANYVDLDDYGNDASLSRARLVPATTMQGEQYD